MIKEPIYASVLSLKLNDAWDKIVQFSKNYPIKKKDKDNAKIVLDIGYPIRMFAYSTWIEGIVISLRPVTSDTTMINIYGKVLLSPHHILRLSTLNNKKIDKDLFLSNAKISFERYEAAKPVNDNFSKKRIFFFWFLCFFSLVSFLSVLIVLFLFHRPNNSQLVTVNSILFLICQAVLITWFTRDCHNNNNLTLTERNKWIACICLTGFIGCLLYYNWSRGQT